jgi:hypothetical protein
MSAQASQTQWYLARDGQQFGPISEAELAKFIELGHLQPTDLLWREGFPDWRPAMVVFPGRTPAPAQMGPAPSRDGQQRAAARPPVKGPERSRQEDYDEDPAPRRGARRAMLVLLALAVLGGAASGAYVYRERVTEVVASLAAFAPSDALTVTGADRKAMETPPLVGFRGSPEEVDTTLQATALWRVLKREFPDWYKRRLEEAALLTRDNKDDAAVAQHMARRLVELRRQNLANALSATLPRLKTVAVTFFDSLSKLRRHSVEACHGFIAEGQANSSVVALLQGSEHTAHLQAQITSVFEAIAEGRTQPRVYPRAQQPDYQLLAADLIKMGWTQDDMRLFSNQNALAQAGPEKLCQLVHDWFAAQLAIKDQETQMRLLVDSLRPIFAG